ncbi:MAG: cell wall-binding repeat-containing protein [Actinobacteria bacterium]|nr:cell wall-binding repeat-containing protein [Actinomycetota bacterium]
MRLSPAVVLLLALVVALFFALGGVASASAPVVSTTEPLAAPKVVRELVNERTENSRTYLLSDGSKRADVYVAPVNYQDAQGQWQAIDTRLVPGPVGTFHSAGTPVSVSVAPGSSLVPPVVSLAYRGAAVTLLLGGPSAGPVAAATSVVPDAIPVTPVVSGSTATFSAGGVDTSMAYQVISSGVKETITLGSPRAPNSFTFKLRHDGLTLQQDETGQWGFYPAGAARPALVLGSLLVFDSSVDSGGDPAYCDGATMMVTPGVGASTVTYTVPTAWLADPARVFPVKLDPTVTQGASADTYICDAYPTTAYGTEFDLHIGQSDSNSSWNRSFVKFDLPADITNGYVLSAHLRLYEWYLHAGGGPTTHVGVMTKAWSEASTWSSLGTYTIDLAKSMSVAQGNWLDADYTSTVQGWANGAANYGWVLYQAANETPGTNYYRKYYARENTDPTTRPQLVINYTTQFDVKTGYGAVGDGVHDDTTNIQNAINAAQTAGGGLVNFPAGTYKITQPLLVQHSNINLQGAGATSILAPAATQSAVIQVGAATAVGVVQVASLNIRIPVAGKGVKVIGTGGGSTITIIRNTFSGGADSSLTSAIGVDYNFSDVWVQANDLSAVTCTPITLGNGGVGRTVTGNTLPVHSYESEQMEGSDRYDTAIRLSRTAYPTGAAAAVLVTGEDYPDALSVAPLAKAWVGPTLLTTSASLDSRTQDELERLKPSTVFVVGLSTTVRDQVLAAVPSATVTLITGTDRYDTAAQVATQVKAKLGSVTNVVIVPGDSYWDALSTAPLAAQKGWPILLTPTVGPIPTVTSNEYHTTLGVTTALVVGVNTSVTIPYIAAPVRINGTDRYDTSLRVADYAVTQGASYAHVGLATGNNYPDALALGSFLGKDNGITLLTNDLAVPDTLAQKLTSNISSLQYLNYVALGNLWVTDEEGGLWLPPAPRHTVYDLGVFAGHMAEATLDKSRLDLTTTDLAVASFGPRAALERTYFSSRTAQGSFALGWRFSYERNLTFVDANHIDYVDEAGETFSFIENGGGWNAPPGLVATLAPSGSNWTLTFQDQTVLTFNSGGRLSSEADANGNTVTYGWGVNALTIQAANGQQIQVTLNGSNRITQATYTTTNGSRQVNYATAAPWTVTYFPGQSGLQHSVTYSYLSNLLTGVTATAFSGATDGVESFTYTGSALTDILLPGYHSINNPDPRVSIAYNGLSATVTRRGQVYTTATPQGVAGTVVTQAFTWQKSGSIASKTNPKSGGTDQTWTYTYADPNNPYNSISNFLQHETSPLGKTRTWTYNNRGNVTSYADELAHTTTYTYPTSPTDPNRDWPATMTDPLGSTTSYTYDTHGNPTDMLKTLSGSQSADTKRTFANVVVGTATFYGAVTQEKVLLTGTPLSGTWQTTDLNTDVYYPNGQPKKTVNRGVALQSGQVSPPDLTITRTYDNFGNLLTQTDLSGVVTETDTYSLAGDLLTRTGPSFTATVTTPTSTQIVDHHSYDAWGHETESWETSSGDAAGQKASWSTTTYDVAGRPSEVKHLLWTTTYPTGQTQSTVDYAYDGLGRKISETDSTVDGKPTAFSYDAAGNLVAQWKGGDCQTTYALGKATRHVNADLTPAYDAANRVTASSAPAKDNSTNNATTYTYTDDNHVLRETKPDLSWTEYTYDVGGNVVHTKTSVSTPSYLTSASYDWGSRLTSQTDKNGLITAFTYDDASRELTATASGQPSSTYAYNTLGWQLSVTDADGFATSRIFDQVGRVTSETTAGNTTTSTWDAVSHLTHQADPNDRQTDQTFDWFGRTVRNTQTLPGAPRVTVKDTSGSFDSLGRPATSTDNVRHLTHSFTYPLNVHGTVLDAQTVGTAGADQVATTLTIGTYGYESTRVSTIASSPQVPTVTRTVTNRDYAQRVTRTSLAAGGTSTVYAQSLYDSADRIQRQWGPDTGAGSGYLSTAATTDAYTYNATSGLKSADNLQLASVGTAGVLTASYTYTTAGRLQTATVNGVAETDVFDAAGNITSAAGGTLTYSSNRLSTMVLSGTTTYYFFDAAQRWRTSQGTVNDPNDVNAVRFTYTGTGRLATYANPTASTTATYTYDESGERTQAAVTIAGQTTTTAYSYEGLLLASLSTTQSGGTGPTSWKLTYLYDENDRPYAGVYRNPGTSTSPVVFGIVTSDRGDVLELLDANGNPFAAYRYDAWGNPLGTGNVSVGVWSQSTTLVAAAVATDIAKRQPLRYAAYCYDTESGLYYLSARHYDPKTRQFLSKDVTRNDGEESAYQYAAGNPVRFTDRTGERIDADNTFRPAPLADDPWVTTARSHAVADDPWVVTARKSTTQTTAKPSYAKTTTATTAMAPVVAGPRSFEWSPLHWFDNHNITRDLTGGFVYGYIIGDTTNYVDGNAKEPIGFVGSGFAIGASESISLAPGLVEENQKYVQVSLAVIPVSMSIAFTATWPPRLSWPSVGASISTGGRLSVMYIQTYGASFYANQNLPQQ